MGFEISDEVQALNAHLQQFMDEHIYPRERDWHEWCHDPEHLWEVPACGTSFSRRNTPPGVRV
jgi:acyl-CoA dehydrogenase